MVQAVFEPTIQSYSPRNVIVTTGLFIMTQFDEVQVRPNTTKWTFVNGCYRQYARKRNTNKLATITLTLPQTAQGNAYNSIQALVDEPMLGLNSVLPVTITDLWGGSLHVMPTACIIQTPEATYSAEPTQRQWVFVGELAFSVMALRHAANSISNMFRR